MSPELNTIGIIILASVFILWKLDFIATLLNVKNTGAALPEEFKEVFDADKYAQSQEYTRVSSKYSIITSVFSLTLFLVFWFLGGFGWLDELSRSFNQGPIITGIIFIGLLYLGSHFLSLPFEIYDTFVIEEKFGFNKTTPTTYFIDQIKGLLLSAALGIPLLALILWIFSKDIPQVWLWAWLIFTGISLLLTYLAPSYILPLFNKFEPMPDSPLRQKIEAMAKDCDFPLTEISIMDGSKRSAKSNAFFTGFGKRKKIALYDTLIDGQTEEGLVGVLAHEIGHFKEKHIVKTMVLSVLQTGLIFFLLGLATNKDGAFAQMLFRAFGIAQEHISVAGGLIFFTFLFKPVSRLLGLFMNVLSRKHEFEADAYAAKAQGTPSHLIEALKQLSVDNLVNLTPHPLRVFLDYSHPPMLQRINALRKLSI